MKVILDLPMPPTANKLWAPRIRSRVSTNKGTGIRTVKQSAQMEKRQTYRDFLKTVEGIVMAHKGRPETPWVGGDRVIVEMTLDEDLRGTRGGDVDNRIKAALDALQLCGILGNDSQIRKVSCEWGETKPGVECCVVITNGGHEVRHVRDPRSVSQLSEIAE